MNRSCFTLSVVPGPHMNCPADWFDFGTNADGLDFINDCMVQLGMAMDEELVPRPVTAERHLSSRTYDPWRASRASCQDALEAWQKAVRQTCSGKRPPNSDDEDRVIGDTAQQVYDDLSCQGCRERAVRFWSSWLRFLEIAADEDGLEMWH